MNTNSENVSELPLAPKDDPKTKRPRGRGAKARSTEKYTRQANEKYMSKKREEVMRRLGVFNADTAALEESFKAMQITAQKRSIPLPVATRGVGFASVAEYSVMVSSWNAETLVVICTIYQYYRVSMFLVCFKLYLSRHFGSQSFPLASAFLMNEEYRQTLTAVTHIPISTYNIINSIGIIHSETDFHCYFPQDVTSGSELALYLTPLNIREVLVQLSNPDTAREHRQAFYDANPVPGARWTDDVEIGPILRNADQIWPEDYAPNQLATDIRAYEQLLKRAGNRLPKSFLVNFLWDDAGNKTATTSMYTAPSRLEATFVRNRGVPQRKKTRRVDGTVQEVDVPQDCYTYQGDVQHGKSTVVECWSPDGTITAMELTVGAASYVGETERIPTRLQVQGRVSASISPGVMLYKFVDAPRA